MRARARFNACVRANNCNTYCIVQKKIYNFVVVNDFLTMFNFKSMKKSHLKSPIFIQVGLTVRTRQRSVVRAFVDIVVLPEQVAYHAASGVDLVSLLDSSLSRSLACFFPFHSVVSLDVRRSDYSSFAARVPFEGSDTSYVASILAADILGQIL